jgi:hypothetical protein
MEREISGDVDIAGFSDRGSSNRGVPRLMSGPDKSWTPDEKEMRLQLFVDMDGVLADFDAHHETVFGIRSSKLTDDVDWEKVRGIIVFYSDMPPMPDMPVLWNTSPNTNQSC